MHKDFEVRVVNLGWKRKKTRVYAVVEKTTITVNGKQVPSFNFVGDASRNYIFGLNEDGLFNAKIACAQLNSGKKVK